MEKIKLLTVIILLFCTINLAFNIFIAHKQKEEMQEIMTVIETVKTESRIIQQDIDIANMGFREND